MPHGGCTKHLNKEKGKTKPTPQNSSSAGPGCRTGCVYPDKFCPLFSSPEESRSFDPNNSQREGGKEMILF